MAGHDDNEKLTSAKRMNKKEVMKPQLKKCVTNTTSTLSKSERRKLKKLEEVKLNDQLQKDSLQVLEKYMVNDDVHALLRSSQSIGQTETKAQKRRRVMQLSKAGVEVDDPQPKRRRDDADHDEYSASVSIAVPSEMRDIDNKFVVTEPGLERCSGGYQGDSGPARLSHEVVADKGSCKIMPLAACADPSVSGASRNGCEEISVVDVVPNGDSIGEISSSEPFVAPTVIHVSRPIEVEESRKELPVIMMEQEIMEAISENNIVVICGKTGCGKTTQVPQFLYEAGFGSKQCSIGRGIIGVTQPRRVAVFSTSERVAYELGLPQEVGYQVRHDHKNKDTCAIKFMTDGILLQELQSDPLLMKYSVIVLDEAHERSLNTDILIAMLPRVVKKRQKLSGCYPLKLVLMSATLRLEDFTSEGKMFLDATPAVLEIPARQYSVTTHFSKRTLDDYIEEAYRKVVEIHRKWPPGGILVFVTGRKEVEFLCRKLRDKLERKNYKFNVVVETAMGTEEHEISYSCRDDYDSDQSCSSEYSETYSDPSTTTDSDAASQIIPEFLEGKVNLDHLKAAFESLTRKNPSTSEGDGKDFISVTTDDCSTKFLESIGKRGSEGSLRVLPLYAMLPSAAQLRVFEEVKEGERLVVVATNVAETSLTIPGIRYVVDTGREKVKKYNYSDGTVSYEIQWISKASAAQREGRAGRTGPGECFRLYTRAAFGTFPEFSLAEISKVPLDGVILLLKSMEPPIKEFPFLTRPDESAFKEAERCLKALGALHWDGSLTPPGKALARFPVSPRTSRFLLVAIQLTKNQSKQVRANKVLGYAVAVAAALSLSDACLFQSEGNEITNAENFEQDQRKDNQENNKVEFCVGTSDALTAANALQCFEQSKITAAQFGKENMVHPETMKEMSKLRKQLLQLVCNQGDRGVPEEFLWTHGTLQDVERVWKTESSNEWPLKLPEENILREAICAGWVDRAAKRVRRKKVKGGVNVDSVPYQALNLSEDSEVYVSRWSSVRKFSPKYLVYTEMLNKKTVCLINGATSVEPEWLVKYGGFGSIYTFSAPLENPQPYYDHLRDRIFCFNDVHFGRHEWNLGHCIAAMENVERRVAIFARALLEGDVLPCLKSVSSYLTADPAIILKPAASSQKRVHNLLFRLNTCSRTVDSCAMLREVWKNEENRGWLSSEIRAWFPVGFQEFEKLWMKMLQEVAMAPRDRFQLEMNED